jgi:hypothetical protein
MPNRHRLARLPQIALHQLAGPIDGPLERAPDPEPRADLAHEVIEDRLAARITELGGHLPKPQRRDRRLDPQLSQIQSLNGSSFDPAGAREYRGGVSLATALATVSRARPVSLETSRCERPSTSTNRRISAHCCTPTTHSSSRDHNDHARLNGQPDNAGHHALA